MDTIKTFVPPHINEGDEHVVRRLAWALLLTWPRLPQAVREKIQKQAGFTEDRDVNVQLAQQIDVFIEKHAGGRTGKLF